MIYGVSQPVAMKVDKGVSAPDGPSADAVRCQLGRILASPEFCAARRRAKFLEYIVHRTLAGQEESLKEYTIAVEVFDRGPQFDPKADGVVRTQAGLMRRHLERYYASEGRHDPVLIIVPKGHYVPKFCAQQEAPLEPAPSGSTPGSRPIFRLLGWASLGAGLATVVLTSGTLARGGRNPAPTATDRAVEMDAVYQPLWGKFLQPGASNVLAFGTPQFFSSGGIWVRDVDVNTPSDADIHGHLRSLH